MRMRLIGRLLLLWTFKNLQIFLCKSYIFNGFDNTLFNVYSPIKIAKELCNSLDKNYKTKDAITKKFIVGRFLD